MRERMFATLGIWAAVAFSVGKIVDSLRYTISTPLEQVTDAPFPQFNVETAFVSGEMQVGAFIILLFIILCAMIATMAIWDKAHSAEDTSAARADARVEIRETQKQKRDRELRVRRLLATMDEDDLAALEEQHIGDDGEQMSVEELLAKRRK
ncbi:MAG: hypothetical protein IAE80_05900 [Anaerolinea sp.]|nr:hypothetical protein [Anaerolinea sp.]